MQLPEEQVIITIKVPKIFNVQQAIEKSGIQKKFPSIDLSKNKVGIFGKKTKLNHLLLMTETALKFIGH